MASRLSNNIRRLNRFRQNMTVFGEEFSKAWADIAPGPTDKSYALIKGRLYIGATPGHDVKTIVPTIHSIFDTGVTVFVNLMEPNELDATNSKASEKKSRGEKKIQDEKKKKTSIGKEEKKSSKKSQEKKKKASSKKSYKRNNAVPYDLVLSQQWSKRMDTDEDEDAKKEETKEKKKKNKKNREPRIQSFPVRDQDIVSDERLGTMAQFVVSEINQGHNAYVHCLGGGGRSGSVACIVLHALYPKLTALEVIVLHSHGLSLRSRPVGYGMTQTQKTQVKRMLKKNGKPKALEELKHYIFFCSHRFSSKNDKKIENKMLSQFFLLPIVDEHGVSYNCNEQYYQKIKADIFGDVVCGQRIMQVKTPKAQKSNAHKISGFDVHKWKTDYQWNVLVKANWFKATQNPKFLEELKKCDEKTLMVEASRNDWVCGIGLLESEARCVPLKYWPGQNKLGKALTYVVKHLRQRTEPPEVKIVFPLPKTSKGDDKQLKLVLAKKRKYSHKESDQGKQKQKQKRKTCDSDSDVSDDK